MRDFLLVDTDAKATWTVALPAAVIAKGVADAASSTTFVTRDDTTTIVATKPATLTSTTAKVSFAAGDLPPGNYLAEFAVSWPDGTVERFREAPRYWVLVIAGIGPSPNPAARLDVMTWSDFAAQTWPQFASTAWSAA